MRLLEKKMKNEDRMNKTLKSLRVLWRKHSDLRLGQLITNALSGDIYQIEDDDFIKALEEFYKEPSEKEKLSNGVEFYAFYPCDICKNICEAKLTCTVDYLEYMNDEGIDYRDELGLYLLKHIKKNFEEKHSKDLYVFDEETVIFVGLKEKK